MFYFKSTDLKTSDYEFYRLRALRNMEAGMTQIHDLCVVKVKWVHVDCLPYPM